MGDPIDDLIAQYSGGTSGGTTTSTAKDGWQQTDVPGLSYHAGTNTYAYGGTIITDNEARQIIQDWQAKQRSSSSYNVSQSYADPASLALDARSLDLKAQDQAFNQQMAKDQWLFQQQNAIDQLQLQRDKFAADLQQNAQAFALENQKLQFAKDQFAFTSALGLAQEARATQGQIFDQQATVAGLQLNMTQIAQHTRELNAQLQNEVAMFNAGKAADVSMFNIDQQTKVATFNAQGQFNASTFNAQMGFEVQKANVENERLRQQQLIDVAGKISEAAKDPGDRGKLAALILALGGGANIGATDAGLANSDLRTNDSLTPLEAMLRQREDIQNSDAHPFHVDPVTWNNVPTPQAATFNPVTATQAPMPDFSGVNIPQVNTTPFNPSSIPTSSGGSASQGTSAGSPGGFIATGNTNTPDNQQFVNSDTGQPLTADQRAQIPDIALQAMLQSGVIKALAGGGLFDNGQVTSLNGQMPRPRANGPEMSVPDGTEGQRQPGGWQRRNGAPPAEWGQMPGWHGMLPPEWQQWFTSRPQNGDMAAWQTWLAGRPQTPMYNGTPNGGASIQPVPSDGGMQSNYQQSVNVNNGGASIQPVAGGNPLNHSRFAPFNTPEWGPNFDFSVPRGASFPVPQANQGGMMDMPMFVAGDSPDGKPTGNEEIVIPIGPGMAVVLPNKQTKKVIQNGSKAKQPKKMASGGVFDQSTLGKSIYEGLLTDTNRQRSMDFLTNALGRAVAGTGFNAQHLPTPVFFSSPGTPSALRDLGGALFAMGKGVPASYFNELAALATPAGYSEGVIGRTR